jgi:UDP-N-acetyl-D-mannosaminuronate dehydrogenase
MPVYPYFLAGAAPRADLTLTARAINDGMPSVAADLLEQTLAGLSGTRVLVLGMSYRPGVKEMAYSPALTLVRELERRGATVAAHDPLFSPEELTRAQVRPTSLDAGEAFDAVVLHTADPAYTGLDLSAIPRLRVVLDCAGALAPARVTDAGLRYLGIGRPRSPLPAPRSPLTAEVPP